MEVIGFAPINYSIYFFLQKINIVIGKFYVKTLSSAKINDVEYKLIRIGPRCDPCGTPDAIL